MLDGDWRLQNHSKSETPHGSTWYHSDNKISWANQLPKLHLRAQQRTSKNRTNNHRPEAVRTAALASIVAPPPGASGRTRCCRRCGARPHSAGRWPLGRTGGAKCSRTPWANRPTNRLKTKKIEPKVNGFVCLVPTSSWKWWLYGCLEWTLWNLWNHESRYKYAFQFCFSEEAEKWEEHTDWQVATFPEIVGNARRYISFSAFLCTKFTPTLQEDSLGHKLKVSSKMWPPRNPDKHSSNFLENFFPSLGVPMSRLQSFFLERTGHQFWCFTLEQGLWTSSGSAPSCSRSHGSRSHHNGNSPCHRRPEHTCRHPPWRTGRHCG